LKCGGLVPEGDHRHLPQSRVRCSSETIKLKEDFKKKDNFGRSLLGTTDFFIIFIGKVSLSKIKASKQLELLFY
jgi:hypothetical protein